MHVRPDGRGLVSGGADKDVKFWDIEEKRGDVCINVALIGLAHVGLTSS